MNVHRNHLAYNRWFLTVLDAYRTAADTSSDFVAFQSDDRSVFIQIYTCGWHQPKAVLVSVKMAVPMATTLDIWVGLEILQAWSWAHELLRTTRTTDTVLQIKYRGVKCVAWLELQQQLSTKSLTQYNQAIFQQRHPQIECITCSKRLLRSTWCEIPGLDLDYTELSSLHPVLIYLHCVKFDN